MNLTKLVATNALVLAFLLALAEIGLRGVWTVRSCLSEQCDFSRLTNLKVRVIEQYGDETKIGLTQRDPLLGYVPTPGFSKVISIEGWNNSLVTINSDGFRSNDNGDIENTILTVGDSFTFGDQVPNNETWPSCIERKLNTGVANAGVFGYGAAQALKRAQIETKKYNYDTLLWSVFLNDDFKRDRMIYRSGFPRPAVIKTEHQTITWDDVPPSDADGTKFGKYAPSSVAQMIRPFYLHSQLGALLIEKWRVIGGPLPNFSGRNLNLYHPNAASEAEIIDFSMQEFSSLPVENKFLVLQYMEFDFASQSISDMRKAVLAAAKKHHVQVIDTFDSLNKLQQTDSASKIWNVHHTALGNSIVCKTILEHIQDSS